MTKLVLALACLLVLASPSGARAEEKPNRLSAALGYYHYSDVIDRTNLDGAVDIEVAYTRSLHPHFALRAGVGYFHDGRQGDDLRGYPVTLTALGVYPSGRWRLFAGGGVGVYPVEYDGRVDGAPVEGDDAVWGGHVLVGATVDIGAAVFAGLEARYRFLDEARIQGRDLDLSGVAILASLGLRF